jgi:hypothetical protein
MSQLGFSSDPHVQYLSQILDEIRQGYLQIPRFQRPVVWDWEQRLDLLRSIRQGIPMGAVMVWRTNVRLIKTYHEFGRFRFPNPPAVTAYQFLLDGVQRLSTLLVSLHIPPKDQQAPLGDSDDDDGRMVFFDLEDDDFVAILEKNASPIRYMPMTCVLDSVSLLRYQRELAEAERDLFIETTDQIAKAFREYKIPIIPIASDDIGLASQTFQRINSSGEQMSEKHMLHALTWSDNFDLIDELENLKDALVNDGWEDISDDLLLRIIKASLQEDIYRADVAEVSNALRSQPALLKDIVAALVQTAEFLARRFGIPSPEMVPYSQQIVALAEFFRLRTPTIEEEEHLKRWVWFSTYSQLFTGLSGDKVNREIDNLRKFGATRDHSYLMTGEASRDQPFRFSATFNSRTALSKAFVLQLAAAQNEAFGNNKGFELLKQFGKHAVATILPRQPGIHHVLFTGRANRFLVAPDEAKLFKERLQLGVLSNDEKRAHLIPRDEPLFQFEDSYDATLLNAREEEITRYEKKVLANLS